MLNILGLVFIFIGVYTVINSSDMGTVSSFMFKMGAIFTIGGAVLVLGPLLYRRYLNMKRRKLMVAGKHVLADVTGVGINYGIKLKGFGAWNISTGQSPYQIVATWTDPNTQKTYEFTSQNIWKNPSRYLPIQVDVYINRRRPEKSHYMDVNFLERSFLALPKSDVKSNLIWIAILGFMLYQFMMMMNGI
ncbi:hypothetical protein V1503_04940 [Bacillus sp. SCS-151]|uniref:hypothetical protein n=1 Tax=Nanhaiella sioensis TaxID=3115293 RepID=UPI00397C2285